MASKQRALIAIEQAGGTIDWDCTEITAGEKHILVDAPIGHSWVYNGCSCFSISWYSGSASAFWDEVIEQVRFGTQAA